MVEMVILGELINDILKWNNNDCNKDDGITNIYDNSFTIGFLSIGSNIGIYV